MKLLKQFASDQKLTKQRAYSDWLAINREIQQLAQPLIKHPMRYQYALHISGVNPPEPMIDRHDQRKIEQAINKARGVKISVSKNDDKAVSLNDGIDTYVKRLGDFQERYPVGQRIKEIRALKHTIQKSVGEDKRLAEATLRKKLQTVACNRELFAATQKQYPAIDKLLQHFKLQRHKPEG